MAGPYAHVWAHASEEVGAPHLLTEGQLGEWRVQKLPHMRNWGDWAWNRKRAKWQEYLQMFSNCYMTKVLESYNCRWGRGQSTFVQALTPQERNWKPDWLAYHRAGTRVWALSPFPVSFPVISSRLSAGWAGESWNPWAASIRRESLAE